MKTVSARQMQQAEEAYTMVEYYEANDCQDGDLTLSAFRLMGTLSAASALCEQGLILPQRWLDDQIQWARELAVPLLDLAHVLGTPRDSPVVSMPDSPRRANEYRVPAPE